MKPDVKKVRNECGYYDEAKPNRNRPLSVELITEVKSCVVDEYHGLEFYAALAGAYEAAAALMEQKAQHPGQLHKARRDKVEAYKKLVAQAEVKHAAALQWATFTANVVTHLTSLIEAAGRQKKRADVKTWNAARPYDVLALAEREAAEAVEAADYAGEELALYQRGLAAAGEAISEETMTAEKARKKETLAKARIFSRTFDDFKKEVGKFSASANKSSAYLQAVTEEKKIFKPFLKLLKSKQCFKK